MLRSTLTLLPLSLVVFSACAPENTLATEQMLAPDSIHVGPAQLRPQAPSVPTPALPTVTRATLYRSDTAVQLTVEGVSADLDGVTLEYALLRADGTQLGTSDPLASRVRYDLEPTTASYRTQFVIPTDTLTSSVQSVRLFLRDSFGSESLPTVVPLSPTSVRESGQACDPDSFQSVCAAGLACTGNRAQDGICAQALPATLDHAHFIQLDSYTRVLALGGTQAANPVRALVVAPMMPDGRPATPVRIALSDLSTVGNQFAANVWSYSTTALNDQTVLQVRLESLGGTLSEPQIVTLEPVRETSTSVACTALSPTCATGLECSMAPNTSAGVCVSSQTGCPADWDVQHLDEHASGDGTWTLASSSAENAVSTESSCTFGGYNSRVISFRATSSGRYRFDATSASLQSPHLVVRSQCGVPGYVSERACAGQNYSSPTATVEQDLAANQTVYLLVGGTTGRCGPPATTFALSAHRL